MDLDQVLRGLAAAPGVLGASVVTRDGLSVRGVGKQALNRESFSAMSATLLGASEIALAEIDPARTRFVVAETTESRLVVLGATGEHLLILCTHSDAKLDASIALAEGAASSIRGLVAP